MPELPVERSEATKIALSVDNNRRAKKVLHRVGKEMIGSGNDSLVFIDPRNQNKAIAISKPDTDSELSLQKAKELYYCHNIFATVFPHNFPHFYGAFGAKDQAVAFHTGTVRERVLEKKTYPFRKRIQPKNPFSEVKKFVTYGIFH